MMMAMMAIRSVVRGGVMQVMRNLISQYQLIIMYIHYYLHHHSCHEYNILLAILWANQMDLVYKDAPPYHLHQSLTFNQDYTSLLNNQYIEEFKASQELALSCTKPLDIYIPGDDNYAVLVYMILKLLFIILIPNICWRWPVSCLPR